jgi:hypothetical protein
MVHHAQRRGAGEVRKPETWTGQPALRSCALRNFVLAMQIFPVGSVVSRKMKLQSTADTNILAEREREKR